VGTQAPAGRLRFLVPTSPNMHLQLAPLVEGFFTICAFAGWRVLLMRVSAVCQAAEFWYKLDAARIEDRIRPPSGPVGTEGGRPGRVLGPQTRSWISAASR
jgi:hypothetical protein